jgi:hypothetical protein
MKQVYEAPTLVEYGTIAECTFAGPYLPRRRHRGDWDHDDPPGSEVS